MSDGRNMGGLRANVMETFALRDRRLAEIDLAFTKFTHELPEF